jgi:protein arginine N-methyltransferase 5
MNALYRLQQRQSKEWQDQEIRLLFGDMRFIDVPEKVDVLVSELLGSFGDNELSPECLDGATRFLKRERTFTIVTPETQPKVAANGISIPSSYTAHLAPLSSSKLYQEARFTKSEKSLETPYVVMFQAVNILSGTKIPDCDQRYGPQVQECWEFEHPRKDVVVNAQGALDAAIL